MSFLGNTVGVAVEKDLAHRRDAKLVVSKALATRLLGLSD